jgi:hypothetical protein
MTTSFNKDLLSEIFGERPELAFLGNLGQAGLGKGPEKFLRGKASDFLQRLHQAVGQQMVGGNLPTLTPEDFFGKMNFQQELGQYSPEQRGMETRQYNPFTNFLYGRR